LTGAPANLAQVPTFDELDDDVRLARGIVGGFQDLGDAWVLELRLDASLIQKACQERAVLFVFVSDRLHDAGTFGAFDTARGSQVDLTHATARDSLEQRVTLEATRQGSLDTGRILL
jgi:hypothetical protein